MPKTWRAPSGNAARTAQDAPGTTNGIRVVEFAVNGIAVPQGSSSAFVPKGWTRAVVTSANRNLKQWRTQVAVSCPRGTFFERGVPVSVALAFNLPRPASLPKKIQHHAKKPDLDKLIRACCDALTSVLWQDDSQVIEVVARKRYAEPAGVRIRVEEVRT